jgi:cytochrome P450
MLKTAPGPKSLFPPARILAFQKDPIAVFTNLKTFGDVACLRLALRVFLISDPELIRQVFLPLNDKLNKGRALARARILLGEGLLTSEGETHTRQRRLIMPAFHRSRIALYAKVMVELAAKLADEWEEGREFELRREMSRLTLEIAGRTMFGATMASDAAAISDALNEVMLRFKLAILPGTMWMRHIPTPGNLRLKRAIKRLDEVVFRMIAERREHPEKRDDLLNMLLEAQDEENELKKMTDQQVRDEVMTLFIAGHESTANALSWAWILLDQNPEVLKKLKEELYQVLGSRLPSPEDYPRLQYTERVFSEILRLYPPAWSVGRRALEDLELGGYWIPKGSILVMSPYLMQRDPRYWKDPEAFDPERFLPEPKASRPQFSYFPFGAGPRACIGEGFAWMEGVLVLATLLQRWQLKPLPGQKLDLLPQFTLRPRHPIMVRCLPS